MKIAIVGSAYVGQPNPVPLAQQHEITAVDISSARADVINEVALENRTGCYAIPDLKDGREFLAKAFGRSEWAEGAG